MSVGLYVVRCQSNIPIWLHLLCAFSPLRPWLLGSIASRCLCGRLLVSRMMFDNLTRSKQLPLTWPIHSLLSLLKVSTTAPRIRDPGSNNLCQGPVGAASRWRCCPESTSKTTPAACSDSPWKDTTTKPAVSPIAKIWPLWWFWLSRFCESTCR